MPGKQSRKKGADEGGHTGFSRLGANFINDEERKAGLGRAFRQGGVLEALQL